MPVCNIQKEYHSDTTERIAMQNRMQNYTKRTIKKFK